MTVMAGPARVVFQGNAEESHALIAALQHNCGCEIDSAGIVTKRCAPHEMLATDQRALNGLLCYRRMRARLRREEFGKRR